MGHRNNELSKRALTEPEAAIYIGMSVQFLRQDRSNGRRENITSGPSYIRVGSRTIRYLIEDLDAWLDRLKHGEAA